MKSTFSLHPLLRYLESVPAVMTWKFGIYIRLVVAVVSTLALTSHSLVITERGGCVPYTRDIDTALLDWIAATRWARSSLEPSFRRVVDWFGLIEPLFPGLSFSGDILRPEDRETLEFLQSS